jgi:hypothetical protein
MELSSLGLGTYLGVDILRWFPAARTPPDPRGRAGVDPSRPSPSNREAPWN